MASSPTPAPLSALESAAWGGFLRGHALITRQLDADLRTRGDLALSEFEILLHLAWAGGERRMAQIADDVILTGGGVTRIVARLEKLGLIERRSCPADGRGVFAVLTERGWTKYRAAQKVHLDGVKRLFLAEATSAELKVAAGLFERVVVKVEGEAGKACAHLAADEPNRPKPSRR